MKSRVRLLLLVALLLPFRGALAVSGWLCHADTPSTSSIAAHEPGHAGAPVADLSAGAGQGGCHAAADRPASAHGDASSCNLCSSICGAAAFPSTAPQFDGFPPPGAERFTAIAPPHAEFASGALERPPRTI